MGSTGSGQFGNYNQSDKKRCDLDIDVSDLEDVALSPYYNQNNKLLPQSNTKVRVNPTPLNGRYVVEEISTGTVIGVLPTFYNYLATCFQNGYSYEGEVTSSIYLPIPSVGVHLESV